ncbi:MAG: hypothetical protein WC071_06595 [Victivallaceae bacterium]
MQFRYFGVLRILYSGGKAGAFITVLLLKKSAGRNGVSACGAKYVPASCTGDN